MPVPPGRSYASVQAATRVRGAGTSTIVWTAWSGFGRDRAARRRGGRLRRDGGLRLHSGRARYFFRRDEIRIDADFKSVPVGTRAVIIEGAGVLVHASG